VVSKRHPSPQKASTNLKKDEKCSGFNSPRKDQRMDHREVPATIFLDNFFPLTETKWQLFSAARRAFAPEGASIPFVDKSKNKTSPKAIDGRKGIPTGSLFLGNV
jgi:hypothetical protein